jgi:hypothetical protein
VLAVLSHGLPAFIARISSNGKRQPARSHRIDNSSALADGLSASGAGSGSLSSFDALLNE